MGRRLTEEQRALAELAWELAQPAIRKMVKRWGDTLDFAGEVGLRIARLIPDFDPSRSALRTWAFHQAYFACLDTIRASYSPGEKRSRRHTRTMSLHAQVASSVSRQQDFRENLSEMAHTLLDWQGEDDPPTPLEQIEAAQRLLRGLLPFERAVLWGAEVEGRTQKAVAEDFGLTESRSSQMRKQAIEFLRYASTITITGDHP